MGEGFTKTQDAVDSQLGHLANGHARHIGLERGQIHGDARPSSSHNLNDTTQNGLVSQSFRSVPAANENSRRGDRRCPRLGSGFKGALNQCRFALLWKQEHARTLPPSDVQTFARGTEGCLRASSLEKCCQCWRIRRTRSLAQVVALEKRKQFRSLAGRRNLKIRQGAKMRILILLSSRHQLVAPTPIEGPTLLVGLVIQSEDVEKVREMKDLVLVKSSAHTGRESGRKSACLKNLENGLALEDISLA